MMLDMILLGVASIYSLHFISNEGLWMWLVTTSVAAVGIWVCMTVFQVLTEFALSLQGAGFN